MAIDAFLQFTKTGGVALDVVGETQDANFRKPENGGPAAFEIKSWGFGAANTSTIGSATMGAGGGKVSFEPFKVQKNVDRATPSLFQTCCAGGHYQLLTLWIRKAGADMKAAGSWYLQWEFAMAFVSKVSWANGDPQPTEDVEFVYGAIRFTYRSQQTSGAIGTDGDKHQQWSQVLNSDEFEVK
jgi:type VI secretion system Hcp family effector